jgi:hypothetical protein
MKKGKKLSVTSLDLLIYNQYVSPNIKQKVPEVTENRPFVIYANSKALEYRKNELANRDNKTAFRYLQYFIGSVECFGTTPDHFSVKRA